MLYNVLSLGKKTPKIAPSPRDFVTSPEENRATATGNTHKKYRQTCSLQYYVTASAVEVIKSHIDENRWLALRGAIRTKWISYVADFIQIVLSLRKIATPIWPVHTCWHGISDGQYRTILRRAFASLGFFVTVASRWITWVSVSAESAESVRKPFARQKVVTELWQKAASHVVLLLWIEWSILLHPVKTTEWSLCCVHRSWCRYWFFFLLRCTQ